MSETRVARDVCIAEFEKLCDARRILRDLTLMNEPERALFEARKRPIIHAMQRGELVIKDGNPVFTPPGKDDKGEPYKPITFYRATGATLMAGDGYGPNHGISRLVAVGTELTKTVPGHLSKLDVADFDLVADLISFLTNR